MYYSLNTSKTRLGKCLLFLFASCMVYLIVVFLSTIGSYYSNNQVRRIEDKVELYGLSHDSSQITNYKSSHVSFPLDQSKEKLLAKEYFYTVKKGDSFIKILFDIGFNPQSAYYLTKGISELYSLKNLRIGQHIKFMFDPKSEHQVKLGDLPKFFLVQIDDKIIKGVLSKSSTKYKLKLLRKSLLRQSALVSGYAGNSLYNSAISNGAPKKLIMDYINLLNGEVNFQKDIKSDSKFKILFNYKELVDGKKIYDGNIIYAYLSLGSRKYEIYQYRDSKGHTNYYHNDGRNIKDTLLSAPIKNARISSGFGMRYHPILKKNKLHKGVDYAAKIGTPILAAGNGVVQVVRYGGGYGKYLAIKHDHQYSTLYAHMSRFKTGIQSGKKVKKGDVIGYVGNTGNSTGAHLHYEIRRYGKAIDPIRVKTLISTPLQGQKLLSFNQQKKKIDQLLYRCCTSQTKQQC